ncbi:MAG: acyl-ACP--UDP-N-acetylglucosamine O-acyltransferase, partial [Sinomicrobium sp.]|nr:acyl-ACP--UDP-N-acetylglucosamine O-acyltransferase [Sinomicrobium sp.]
MNQPLAYVHPGAKIAKNVVIEPFSTIHNNVVVGEGTWIASNVTVMEGARIGKNCSIFPGSVISAPPQDLKYQGEDTTAEIGDNTTIRECVTVNKGTADKMRTVIGKNCLIMAYCHIAHDCFVGDNCIFSNNSTLAGHIVVDQYAVLAGMVAVHQFCKIGQHAFVTGGSLVRKDVPPYAKAAREPL